MFIPEADSQIVTQFPVEYNKRMVEEAHGIPRPLPGRSARQKLSILGWLRFTLGKISEGLDD